MNEQVDATYTHSIEKLVTKVCMLSRENGDTHEKRCLRASSLQCLSAMVIVAPFDLLRASDVLSYLKHHILFIEVLLLSSVYFRVFYVYGELFSCCFKLL